MKLRYIYIIVLCILTSGCNYLDIMPDERAKLEDSYNTPSKTEGFLYSCYTYMPMNPYFSRFTAVPKLVSDSITDRRRSNYLL